MQLFVMNKVTYQFIRILKVREQLMCYQVVVKLLQVYGAIKKKSIL